MKSREIRLAAGTQRAGTTVADTGGLPDSVPRHGCAVEATSGIRRRFAAAWRAIAIFGLLLIAFDAWAAFEWAGNQINDHDAWQPSDSTWVSGNAAGYSEGETAVIQVAMLTDATQRDWKLQLCIDQDVDQSGPTPSYAFTKMEDVDRTYTVTLPDGVPLTDTSLPDIQAHNAVIVSRTFLGVGPDPGAPGSICPVNYLAYEILFTTDAGLAAGSQVYIIYGAHLAQSGDPLEEPPPSNVPADKGASSVDGTFQTRIASEGQGDKTLNFKAANIDVANADLSLDVVCPDYNGADPPYTYRFTTLNNGPSGAFNTLELIATFLDPTVVDYTGFSSTPAEPTTSCVENPEGTVTCILDEPLGAGETWVVDMAVTLLDTNNGNANASATVEADLTSDSDTSNNTDGCSATTPVTLASFKAVEDGSDLIVEFATVTEAGNLGFYLYGERRGEWVQLGELIESHVVDSVEPQFYRVTLPYDGDVSFMLRDVDIFGDFTDHQNRRRPFELGRAYGKVPSSKPVNWASKRAEHVAKKSARTEARKAKLKLLKGGELENPGLHLKTQKSINKSKKISKGGKGSKGSKGGKGTTEPNSTTELRSQALQTDAPLAPQPLVMIEVAEAGVYRVTHQDLLGAGLDMRGAPIRRIALLDPAGNQVPLHISSRDARRRLWRPGASFTFIGEPRQGSLYGSTNSYRLILSDGAARMARDTSAPADGDVAETQYVASVEVAEQNGYSFSAPIGDPWYMERMLCAVNNGACVYEFDVDTDGYEQVADGSAEMHIDIWGGLDYPDDEGFDDHYVRVRLNDGPWSDGRSFDGIVAQTIGVDTATLREGTNLVSVELGGRPANEETPFEFDLVYLEGIRIDHPRELIAGEDGLAFSASGSKFSVSGLTEANVQVYRADGDGRAAYLTEVDTEQTGSSYTATFAGSGEAATYHVVGAGGVMTANVEPAAVAESCAGAYDYLAIVHPDFAAVDALDDLLDRRAAQGLTVRKVTTDGINVNYSGGLNGPEAIQACVNDAVELKSLLLVGGDTNDPEDNLGLGSVSYVPTAYVKIDPFVSFTPCDACAGFADGEPRVAVGRLPVRSTAELERVLARIEAYEAKDYGRSMVIAADLYDEAQGYDFRVDAEEITAIFQEEPYEWGVTKVYLDQYYDDYTDEDEAVQNAREDLVAGIEAGAALTSYVGHSSHGLWTFSGLFDRDVAALLQVGDRPTVVTQWGCWNTYHVAPESDTMAHGFLFGDGDEENGTAGSAAAVLGASGLTQAWEEAALAREFSLNLRESGTTLGDALIRAKQSLMDQHPGDLGVIYNWSLLGDPAMVVEPIQP